MRIVFMGTPQFAVPSLENLIEAGHSVVGVITQPDRPKGRGQQLALPPIKTMALQRGMPVWQPESINSDECLASLRSWSPEVIVVVAFGQILKRAVLDLPSLGCINVHGSVLPKYRGAAPIQRAIIQGETVTGITTMYMNERMDAGDMILRREVAIKSDDTAGTLEPRLAMAGADLLMETMKLIERHDAPRLPQKDEEATFAPMLRREDAQIHWASSANAIRNRVRGVNPSPGAFTFHQQRVLKVWKVSIHEAEDSGNKPGEVSGVDGMGCPIVQTGDGRLRLEEVQPQDKRRMAGAEWARGSRVQPGHLLG